MDEQLTTVVLALGSNLGDRMENLQRAVRELDARGVSIVRASDTWETAPVPADQPFFLNAVLVGQTHLAPQALLDLAKAIEHEMGRRPGRRWGPRPIDVDILFYGDEEIATATLQVPHPRIAERGFVLAPLADAWDGPLPVLGRTAKDLLTLVGTEGLRRAGPLAWR